MEFNFTQFEDEFFPAWISQFKSGSEIGEYSFEMGGPTSVYGTTDMLISRYILDDLHLNNTEKTAWAKTINQFQNPSSGWYEKTYTMHYKEHTTAYAVAALYLIDQKPTYPSFWKENILKSVKSQEKWIKHPNWSFIWATSHIISGVPAILAMTKEGTKEFFNWYFKWLGDEVDPQTGFWRRGFYHKFRKPHFHDMAGAFHMYYVYEFLEEKWPYPEKIVDYTLQFQHENGFWDKDVTYCVDLDGLYCILRSSRNAGGYRQDDVYNAVVKYLRSAEALFNDKERFFQAYGNSHRLTGALSAIAECQKFYPELVITNRKWVQSLDKACYI